MNFNYDYFGLAEPARFYLCKTDNTIICELNGIDLQSVSYTKQLNNFDTIQFDVHRYVNGEESNGYDMLDEAMYIFVDGIGYFRMSYPEVSNDGFDEYKSITAQSCECELALKTLKNFKINTGETDSYEYLAPGNVEETDEGVKIAKKSITLYDQYNPELSLLHLALSKVSGWKIGIVDQTVAITTIEEPTVNEDGSVTTKTVTSASKRTFDIDSKSVYAFLTQDVSKKFECIFEFDIIKREINVRDVDTYGKDSNVFISYRNLIQELNYSPAQENNILTRFDVRGADDLTIDAVNFGTSTIEDLSYYLNTKHHVSDDLVDHYNKWLKAIEEARKKYMYYNRQYNILMEKRDEVNNRVPNDGLNNNWKQFTVEELETIKKKYTGYMEALKDKDLGYWDATNKKWLNKGAEQDYIAYQGILEIIDQTIKYKQASVTETEKEKNNLDDLLEEWNTNWDLFGLAELKTKEKTYKQNIEALAAYAKAWEDLGEDEQGHLTKANYDISHNQYVKYVGYESGCSKAIDERQKEYDGYQSQMTAISKNMADVAKVNDKKSYGFSDAELNTLNKLYNDTDYTNDNILTTSIDTAEKIINTQYDLFNDATTELSKVCRPQLSFTLTMDNIFAIPGFKEWQGNFDIGNFIHLSFDENEQYFLKLRISSLTFNPCIIENDFQIEFTDMIDYNGGRNDFAALLDESVSTAKNQITGSVKSKLDTSGIEVSDSLIKALVKSSVFTGAVSNGVFDTVSANVGSFGQVLAQTINAKELMANSGLFETIDAGDGNIRSVLAVEVNASRMSVGTLAVDRLILRGENSVMYELNKFGDITETKIPDGELDKYYLNGKHLQVNTLAADRIISHTINSEQITTDNIRGASGWINLANGTFLFFNGITKGTSNQTDTDMAAINAEEWLTTSSGISWDGKKLAIKGDVVATSLTLGNNASVSGIYTSKEVDDKLSDYTPTSQLDYNKLNNLPDMTKYLTEDDENENGRLYYYIKQDGGIGDVNCTDPDDPLNPAVGYFKVAKEGLLICKNAIIDGVVYARAGKFTGDIEARSLILGSGVTIPYKNLSDSPDLGIYISKDGEIGTISSDLTAPDGAKGYFKVSTNGLLIADNAYISGTIYAQNGTFAGELKAATGSFTGELKAATGTFAGKLSAATGSFTGEITADKLIANTAGNIAGWTITSDALSKNQGYNTSGGAYFGISGLSISDKFVVSSDGVLNATGATISGDITASSGKIGGYKIENGRLYNHMYGTAGSSSLGYSCGFSVNGGTDHTLWAGNENFYVNMDGSMHCSKADITGSITASGDNSSISTINGNTRVTLNNGRLVISNGDPSNAKTYRALIGLDNEGNNAWVCMYGTDGYVSDPPVMLSSSGVKGWITNSESSNYRPAICTSTAKENSYVSIICTNGTNQVLIRGLYNTDSYKDYTIKVTTSDARLKNNIASTKVTNALQQLLKINHREFNWKSSGEYTDIGYIAQELETINPRLVMKPVSKDGYYEIDTFYMTSLITKSIQEMYAELKEENYKLKNELDSLKKLYKVNNN